MFRIIAYLLEEKNTRTLIDEDINHYLKWDNCDGYSRIKRLRMCLKKNDYLAVFHYRICSGNKVAYILEKIGNLFHTCPTTVEIGGDIKGGLLISHCNSIVYPRKAGKNLRIGPGVVIGRVGEHFPNIGDNVYVAANATVIGNVVIGNNVIIGAGSVVTKDIPNNSVAIGNPAKVIRNISENDSELMNEIY